MIRNKVIDRSLLDKAEKAQCFILDNAKYATVILADYGEHSIICHGDQNISNEYDKYTNAISFNRKKDCFQLCKYNGCNNSISNNRNIQFNLEKRYNNCNNRLEWDSNGVTKDLDDVNSGNITQLLDIINNINNIVKLDNILKRITIWDDGTYRITIYKPTPERRPVNECNNWYKIVYKWSQDKIIKYSVNGKLLNNKSIDKEIIKKYDINRDIDYIEEFNNRYSIWITC